MPLLKQKARIVKIQVEAPGVKTYFLQPLQEKQDFKPGQFYVLSIPAELGGGPKYSRSYSIASSPTDELVEFTMHKVGMFTGKMDELKEGDEIFMQGPFGHFVYDAEKDKDAVFIAGGVGITPFRSMWRFAAKKHPQNKCMLLFSCKTQEDVIYKDELKQGNAPANLQVKLTLTREPTDGTSNWNGLRGRIDADFIKKHCAPVEKRTYFICGSNAMNDGMSQLLLSLGVPKEQVRTEKWGEF